MQLYIGFDSAWTDNPKAPGAICAVGFDAGKQVMFEPPRLVSYDQALTFIQNLTTSATTTLIALDQPTIVPNATSMRPVERVAASLVSWLGGGVQPANRGKTGMFCDASPIWRFLTALDAIQEPENTRDASSGVYLVEVFPALALASMDDDFFGYLRGPRYNPARKKTFRLEDWKQVADVAAAKASEFGCIDMANWCRLIGAIAQPKKADQDMLDSVLCALIAVHWRARPRQQSMLLGDLVSGYMVLPASPEVRQRLLKPAQAHSVPVDGQLF